MDELKQGIQLLNCLRKMTFCGAE